MYSYVFAFMTDTGNISLTLMLMSTYNSSVIILDFRKSLREAVGLCLKLSDVEGGFLKK